jgi:hypothetical protein
MGRLVRKPTLADLDPQTRGSEDIFNSGPARTPAVKAVAGDNYLERMVKYVPAEIIGFSMVINAILSQAVTAGGKNATMAGFSVSGVATVALIVALILTPLFCWYVREDGDAWAVNAVVSTLAFPFWAYLMGAVAFADFHDGSLAVILILTFTAVSGLVAPLRKRQRKREQKAMPKDGPRLVDALSA